MKKTMLMIACLMMAEMALGDTEVICSADSTSTAIDLSIGIDEPLVDSLAVSWDASWIGGDANATAVVSDNSTEVKRVTGAGEFTHAFSGIGRHELVYTTYVGGVPQSEIYSVSFFKDWKYEVRDGGAVITETTQKTGDVTIPSVIDGYTVTGIAGGAFAGCTGLTSITIPTSVTRIDNGVFDGCVSLTQRVALDQQDGSGGTQSVTATYYRVMPSITVPTRPGYTFRGYWTGKDGTGTQYYNASGVGTCAWEEIPQSTLTLYAYWKVNRYTVSFDANGGTGGKTVTQDYGTALTAPTVTRTGYTFNGWSPSAPSMVPAGNVTYTAQWKVNQYTVTFDANGGSGGKTVTQEYGTVLFAPMVTRTGYTFTGWSPSVPTTVPASNMTYTAQWQINKYTVTFDANGGTVGGIEGGTLATNGWKLVSIDDVTEEYQSASIGNNASTSMSLTLTGQYDFTFFGKCRARKTMTICVGILTEQRNRVSAERAVHGRTCLFPCQRANIRLDGHTQKTAAAQAVAIADGCAFLR